MPGLWNQQDVPHKDWTCTRMEDLKRLIGSCEFCGTALRYVHYHTHPDYPGEHAAGCCCASLLTTDRVGPKRRESRLKSEVAARDRWLRRTWKISSAGCCWIKDRGVHVVICREYRAPNAGKWTYRIDGVKSLYLFTTEPEALVASFDGWYEIVSKRQETAEKLAELEVKLATIKREAEAETGAFEGDDPSCGRTIKTAKSPWKDFITGLQSAGLDAKIAAA